VSGLFKWGGRKEGGAAALPVPVQPAADVQSTSKVLPRFLSALSPIPSPVLLNLGPVVGQNIAFFGDRLSCKIFVEDLFEEVDAHAKRGTSGQLAEVFEKRFTHAPGSVDGIICWDLFDFLDKKTSQWLAPRLVTLLRPGGVLYGFFGTTSAEVSAHTRFIVEAPDKLTLKSVAVPPLKRHVLEPRDLNKIFEGLVVTESVLLKTSTRETLFRKT